MSHVAKIALVIKDLAALKEAIQAHFPGATLIENQKTYKWYGKHMGDYPLPEGIKKEDLGKCDHAIRLKGCEYEIGLRKMEGGGFTPLFDFWGPGKALIQTFGEKLGKLQQTYAMAVARRHFIAKGKQVTITKHGDKYRLRVAV